MHDTDDAVAGQNDRYAIGGTHREPAAGTRRECSIGLGPGVLGGLGDLDDGRAVDLVKPGRAGIESPGVAEIAVGPGRDPQLVAAAGGRAT
jgi:hypothetical protein